MLSTMFHRMFLYIWILLIVSKESNGEISCGSAHKLFESCLYDDISNSTKVFLQQSKIPLNQQEIHDYCHIFNRGIRCYNEYADKCISDAANRRLIEGEIMPAKNFYGMLCKDNVFKKDYLSHRDCYRFVEKDWEKCTNHFHDVINSEFEKTQIGLKSNINLQYMHFCCARYSYEKCVENSARSKCKPDSAKFTRRLVELLSTERQFKKCARIEQSLCSSASSHRSIIYLVTSIVAIIFQLKSQNLKYFVALRKV